MKSTCISGQEKKKSDFDDYPVNLVKNNSIS